MAVSIAEYDKALRSLEEAFELHLSFTEEASKRLARDACIQRFEFCVELGWKTAGRIMGSSATAANTVIREMARDGLIDDPELWFSFVVARNQSSHTYDENEAQRVFKIAQDFLPHGQELLKRLKKK
jgi:nucleotidyltransferase substrate binding protein (TIGR01987 family)